MPTNNEKQKVKTLIKILFLTESFIFCFSTQVVGQKQANHWFTLGYHFDFNFNPVRILSSDIPNSGPSQYSSISDHQGNLLFVTNNETVFDKNLNPMPNGETGIKYNPLNGINLNSLVIPRPGTSQFYIFMGSSDDNKISYAVVDMDKNNGLGDVSGKAKELSVKTVTKVAATGNCNVFWLFIIQLVEDPKIKFNLLKYKIDHNGFDETPDTVSIGDYNYFSNLTFSPDGKSLVFLARTLSGNIYESVLCDFDMRTGTISNPIIFKKGPAVSSYEFSSHSSKLYLSIDRIPIDAFDLLQYDIEVKDSMQIRDSEELIYHGSSDSYVQGLKLSPNGKIICQVVEDDFLRTGVINFPDETGIKCDFQKNAYSIGIFAGHTNFVSTFLSPQFDENFDISAGESTETCTDVALPLGKNDTYGIDYQWYPSAHLSNPKVANPTFLYSDTISVKTKLEYILEGKKGYCHNTDTVSITVHPDLQASVFGSKSVCPRVTKVDYWAEADDRFRYDWSVEGGDLVSGQHSDSILVNWGATNPHAGVTLTPYNALDCPSGPITFPVRINVELQTKTPRGDELICANLGSEIPYNITNTNGSIYTWQSDFGTVQSGQGSNAVTVDWPGKGSYKLWVKEQSTTIDTVCYGVSDSLLVDLFEDTTSIAMDLVGIDREATGDYELQWYVNDTSRLALGVEVYKKPHFSMDWEHIQTMGKRDRAYAFPDTAMNYVPMDFKLSSVNGCQELIESEVHTAIFLSGSTDSVHNSMGLQWTPYEGWGQNIEQYEVWYSKDDESQPTLVASLQPNEFEFANNWGDQGFVHRYRIRALHSSYPFESWSNEVVLSYDHQLEIPNVFTPNGDGVNDSFDFPMLELFHENELKVYDRYGKEVFARQNYDGRWTGQQLASGTYYYSFTEKHYHKTYKGWVQIMR